MFQPKGGFKIDPFSSEPLLNEHDFLDPPDVQISPSNRLELNESDSDNEFGGLALRGPADNFDDDASFAYAQEHCHQRTNQGTDILARNQLIGVSVLCFIFMIGEIVGGVYADSLALMTDASHLASDLASFLISILAICLSAKQSTKNYSFGYSRAEVLGALSSVIILWAVTGVLVYLAVNRFIHKEHKINADDMLITAGCGVAFNVIMGIALNSQLCGCKQSHGHSHFGHGHSHDVSPGHGHGSKVKHEKNINIRSALIHVVGDLIQSVGVLIAAFIIKMKPEYQIADPICTFLFSILVLFTTITVMRDILRIIMEGTPRNVDYKEIYSLLLNIDGVKMVHSLHVWSLTSSKSACAVHLAVSVGVNYDSVVRRATTILQSRFKIRHCTIQVESFQPNVMLSCPECNSPAVEKGF